MKPPATSRGLLTASPALLAICLLSVPVITAAAQTGPVQLEYRSDLEHEMIRSWLHDGSLPTDLLPAILIAEGADEQDLERYARRIEEIYTAADRVVRSRRSADRNARTLFRMLHSDVLKRYHESGTLRETLGSGRFNCVSATALFHHLLARYGIPAEIRLTPSHTYVVIPAERKSIHVELTDPSDGFDFNADINSTVQMLLQYKLITEEEVAAEGIHRIYYDHVEGSEAIDPELLVAVTYYNRGLALMGEGETEPALYALEKAMALDPDRTSFYDAYVLALALLSFEYTSDPVGFAPFVDRATAYTRDDFSLLRMMLPYVEKELIHYTDRERDHARARDRVDSVLVLFAQDSVSVNSLHRMADEVDYTWAWSLNGTGHLEAAFEKIEELYRRRPEETRFRESYARIGANRASEIARRGRADQAIELARQLHEQFPEYPVTSKTVAHAIGASVYQNNLLRREPERARDILMEAYALDPEHQGIRQALANAYYEMSMAKIRSRDYGAALNLITEGLTFYPDNHVLLDTRREIEELLR